MAAIVALVPAPERAGCAGNAWAFSATTSGRARALGRELAAPSDDVVDAAAVFEGFAEESLGRCGTLRANARELCWHAWCSCFAA
jgi:hypothetical protein